MSYAAEQMQRAADSIDSALYRHQQFMTEWLDRFQTLVESLIEQAKQSGA